MTSTGIETIFHDEKRKGKKREERRGKKRRGERIGIILNEEF